MFASDDKKVLNELSRCLADGNSPADDLPLEHLSDFSCDSMDFQDVTAVIIEHTEDVFAKTARLNRHSAEYLKTCRILEKAVIHLGSAFITKTALTVRKFDVSKLDHLSAERLYQMMSFNFRKCDAALREIKEKEHRFDNELFDMLLSFDTVMARLRATQNRSKDINLFMAGTDPYAGRGMAFTENDSNRKIVNQNYDPAPFRNSPSYELRTDILTDPAKAGFLPVSSEPPAETQQLTTDTVITDGCEPQTGEDPAAESLFRQRNVRKKAGLPDPAAEDPSGKPEIRTDAVLNKDTAASEKLQDVPQMIREVPPFAEILSRAARRGDISENGEMRFTEEEMKALLEDSFFVRYKPDLAAAIRKALDP